MNASRCPGLVLAELAAAVPGGAEAELMFEERPLGAVSTLCRLGRSGAEGTWVLSNTDMVMDVPFARMMERHRETGADWTVLTGDMPSGGEYGTLYVDGDGAFGVPDGYGRHYLGISILQTGVIRLATELQGAGTMFGDLAPEARRRGLSLRSFEHRGAWLDMGSLESIRRNLLGRGTFVHPHATVSRGAVLGGSCYIGRNCLVAEGSTVVDSVMLDSSVVESGELREAVLPWFCRFPEDAVD